MDDLHIYEEIVQAKRNRSPAALAVVVATSGSSPRKAGAKMLVRGDGAITGTIGGGKTEAETIAAALQVMRTGIPRTMDFSLTEQHGHVCGGNVTVYLEPVTAAPPVLIVGAGHVGRAVARAAEQAGFFVTLIDTAIALEHVHDSGFMHLDFKPENVLVTRNGNIRLVDFDLAHLRPSKPKRMWRNPGTPPYMAPEVIRREPMDHRADIFSFGVVAYEMLTYRKPFPGESAEEVLRAQMEHNLALPSQHNPDIHLELEKIIMRCLEFDSEKRYPDMSMVVHALEAVLYV